MKKFLLGLIFALVTVSGFSQNGVIHQDWKVRNEGEWASFYYGVTRTQTADYQGKYYYYVYFFSNSYFNSKSDGYNYDRASTYVRNIKITMNEYKSDYYGNLQYYNSVSITSPGYTCDWAYVPEYYVVWFWSYYPYNKFKITHGKVSAFDYSIY